MGKFLKFNSRSILGSHIGSSVMLPLFKIADVLLYFYLDESPLQHYSVMCKHYSNS